MVKRYFDGWFHSLLGCRYNFFEAIDQIPEDVDIVGISFYHNNVIEIQKTINILKTKTKKLLVNLSEPTTTNIVDLFKNNSDVQFYSDIVTNFLAENLKTGISWFITHENYYATSLWAQQLMSQLKSGNKNYKFDCLLGSPKEHRNKIASLYQSSPVKDQIFFTYYKLEPQNGVWDINYDTNTINGSIFNDRTKQLSAVLPVSIYNQSYFSIVAETTAFNEFSQYTEKIAKPIIAQRPFVVFCGQYYLKNLRSLGFRTFDSIIDETYDSVSDISIRFKLAWDQVEYLCSLDPIVVMTKLEEILEHNRRVLLRTDWHRSIYSDIGILPIPKQLFADRHCYE